MPHIDLLELPYFDGISIDAVVSLIDRMEPRNFAPGAVIMQEAEGGPPALYIATSGRVAIAKKNPSQPAERTLAELDSPTLFGEIEIFCHLPPVTTVRALTPVCTFRLTRTTFDTLLAEGHPALMSFSFNVARVACHRLAIADELLASLMGGEDLVKMRHAVFNRMAGGHWSRTTGVFKKPV
jgi:CRP-like cAMP-binding protein